RHNDRRPLRGREPSRATRVDRIRRAAMRLLPIRPDHVGFSAACAKGESDGRRYRSSYARQSVPLRNLFRYSRSDSSSGSICERHEGRIHGRCPMSAISKLDRRSFLKTSAAAAGGLGLAFYLPESNQLEAQGAAGKLNAYVQVGTDDSVTLFIHKAEMGQGTVTSLSMLLAEEL